MNKLVSAALILLAALALSGCIKPNTFNPYAAPEKSELDRLQRQINDRPDLETAERQLTELDARIRAVIATYSPKTVIPPSKPSAAACNDPFGFNIGQDYRTENLFGEPAPTSGDVSEIGLDLKPVFAVAGLRPNTPPGQPQPAGNLSVIGDDGTQIDLTINAGVVTYMFSSGCRLPAAWRTGPPPPDARPYNDPDVHYPYLYGDRGGRTAKPV